MKKLKNKLERKICNILSSVALYCEGRKCFNMSNLYCIPLSNRFFVEIKKHSDICFNYYITLKREGSILMGVILEYDLYRKDVPIQRAYHINGISISESVNNIIQLENILEQLKEDGY